MCEGRQKNAHLRNLYEARLAVALFVVTKIRTLMTMWNKDDQFGNFWLERHFDREKDSEKYLKISLSTDRFENRGLEGRLIENALFLIYADP